MVYSVISTEMKQGEVPRQTSGRISIKSNVEADTSVTALSSHVNGNAVC